MLSLEFFLRTSIFFSLLINFMIELDMSLEVSLTKIPFSLFLIILLLLKVLVAIVGNPHAKYSKVFNGGL